MFEEKESVIEQRKEATNKSTKVNIFEALRLFEKIPRVKATRKLTTLRRYLTVMRIKRAKLFNTRIT